jgi:type III restriction enzyme
MDNEFFKRPIINSPYDYPSRYWELDEHGQPTQRIKESRRHAEFITPPVAGAASGMCSSGI